MLKIHTTNVGTSGVMRLEGRIVRGETEILRNALQSLPDVREVILDLARVTTIDAGGLGVMLELRGESESKGIRFTLVNPTKLVSFVLEITRLASVFQIGSGVEFFQAASRSQQVSALASCA